MVVSSLGMNRTNFRSIVTFIYVGIFELLGMVELNSLSAEFKNGVFQF